jgi:tripartite-type tricarboxylate transporter receptor subunit TctC
MKNPELTERMHREGYEVINQSPEQFAKDIVREREVWEKLIVENKIIAE